MTKTSSHTHTIIELNNVCFSYASHEIVKDVSLQIHKGDYVGIVGPNGAGKSTLVKLMLGILKPSDGTIKIFNKEIAGFKDWYKIGYVPQKTFIESNFPITVEEMVSMGRYARRGLFHPHTKEDKEKTMQALNEVDMLDYRKRQISDLSQGLQQRVFIARALASEPEIIFLDEPTAGVDIKTQKQFYALLRRLNKKMDLTLVLVSHELDILAHEATELVYINRNLVYYGDPEEFIKGEYFHELIGKGGLHH